MDQKQVEICVNLICELGCGRVREVIATLLKGGTSTETESASPAERIQILQQLQDIMAIYDARH